MSGDQATADAFASSWNNLPPGSVYSTAQFEEWFEPLGRDDVEGRRVLELGCGGGSLLVHMAEWSPSELVGVDLGDSVESARRDLAAAGATVRIEQHDLTTFRDADGFDLAYCIGVLHHLKEPETGFRAVLANTRAGGRFHCWVYAHEGNAVIRLVVDPIRKVASKLPWRVTKYLLATPLVAPYFVYAKAISRSEHPVVRRLPLYEYSRWISQRGFGFFRHVAFDQLVTPQTAYLRRETIERWLTHPDVEPGSTYVVFRNGNSWKFGGRRREGSTSAA